MAHPLLFEVNTRCWLRAWSDRLGRPVTLATVPEEEIASWKSRGFTHIWLMGVWATGAKTRALARDATPSSSVEPGSVRDWRGGETRQFALCQWRIIVWLIL